MIFIFCFINKFMACNSNNNYNYTVNCVDENGCLPGVCPDFIIRRHDTKPDFKIKIEDCEGPLDVTGLILEASMWARGKIKTAIADDDTSFGLADNIGFNQIMIGDVIIVDRPRLPEKMLVTGFDEENRLIQVERGYDGTTAQVWKKGTSIRIMKFVSAAAQTEMVYQDVLELDGTTTEDVLMETYFVYPWNAGDTCLAGCYYLEFKLIKETVAGIMSGQSFVGDGMSPEDFGCGLADGIDWVRKFPLSSEGFLIKITESPSVEI